MGNFKIIFVVLALTAWVSNAFAGAVSGGGGGTTNPNPANPAWIDNTILFYSGPILLTWVQRAEQNFHRLSDEEQQSSDLRWLFASSKNVYEVLDGLVIEMEMSRPCFDSFGQERDGSIHGRNPGAICISPYSMAPKLTEYNYGAETLALIIHELAHIMGADERPALVLQEKALRDFMRINFLDTIVQLSLLARNSHGSTFGHLLWMINMGISVPEILNHREIRGWSDQLIQIRSTIDKPLGPLLLLSVDKKRVLTPQFTRISVIEDYVCAEDERELELIREDCKARIVRGFADDDFVTAREFLIRRNGFDHGEDYDEVVLGRMDTTADLVRELTELKNYLTAVRQHLEMVDSFRFRVQRFRD